MPQYEIHQHARPSPGVFQARGAVADFWRSRQFETIIAGPADTGKTWGSCQLIDALCWKYAGSQHVIARKTLTSLFGTVLLTWQKVLGDKSPVRAFGGRKPQWYDYPNGSRVWLAGLDKVGTALSSERDTIYVNQCEELELNDWEVLGTRCSGRGAVMPYTRLMGDANPGPPTHWILHRKSIRLLASRHEDNPTLYDEAGNLLDDDKVRNRMAVLDNLSGHRYYRLRRGLWVAAEGVVYDAYGPHNVIKAMPAGWRRWRKIRSIDFGYTNPFVCQWWAIDPDGRMYLYREIYMSKRLVEDHAVGLRDPESGEVLSPGIVQLSEDDGQIEATVCDHDAEDRATLERYGVYTTAAYKSIREGLEATENRLRKAGDGKPRLFVLEGCTVEHDPRMSDQRRPAATQGEFDAYIWPPGKDGKEPKEEPLKLNDHGMDAMRYAVAYVDLRGPTEYVVEDQPEVFS